MGQRCYSSIAIVRNEAFTAFKNAIRGGTCLTSYVFSIHLPGVFLRAVLYR